MATLVDYNYYEDQINKVDPHKPGTKGRAHIKIEHNSGSTNWLDLNDESAEVLIKFLRDNYNVK